MADKDTDETKQSGQDEAGKGGAAKKPRATRAKAKQSGARGAKSGPRGAQDAATEDKPAKRPASRRPARKTGSEKTSEGQPAAKEAGKPPAARRRAAAGSKQPDQGSAAKPAAPKPAARRRAAPEPRAEPSRAAPQRPVVRARAKYIRSSARKARLVMDHVRGKSVGDARAVLRHSPRGVARDVERLLESAIANAENNHELVGDDLYVKEIYADEGPTLKRYRARAQGRVYRVRKRTSHLTVTLTPKE